MNKKRYPNLRNLLFTCLCLLLPLYASIASAAASQDLKAVLASINAMQGNFSQSIYNQRGRLIRTLHGTMLMARPNKFRWEIRSPFQQLILADGQYLWVYDRGLRQVTRQRLRGSRQTPAGILSGAASGALNDFFVSKRDDWFVLRPKFNIGFQVVRLRFQANILRQMELVDSLGQTSRIVFSQMSVNPSLDSRYFTFYPPKGVDVIAR
jgi:outer membrane lipoprotein carrier protein